LGVSVVFARVSASVSVFSALSPGTSAVLRGCLRRYAALLRNPMTLIVAFALLAALITATAVAD
jgi:hypothetical protein